LLRDRRVTWALTLVFAVVGSEAALRGRYFHDEGLLSWYFASLVRAEPVAALFFQKVRPTMALLYAPIAGLGFEVFAVVHTLVAAAGIPMIVAIARKFGHRAPNVAGLVLASSPLYMAAAPSGQSNVDGVVGLIVACWLLYVRERPGAAGAVLASLLLIRSELAVFALVIVGERLWADRRDLRVVYGAVTVALVYGLAGAAYHRDLSWMLHYPPAVAQPAPDAHWREGLSLASSLAELGPALLALTPALPLAVLARQPANPALDLARSNPGPDVARSNAPERALAWATLGFICAIRGFPLIGLFNFDNSPRYLLCGLPGIALLVSRQVDDSYARRDESRFGFVVLVVAAIGGVWLSGHFTVDALFGALVVALLALGLRRAGRPSLALASWVLPALLSLPWLLPTTNLVRRDRTLDLLVATWQEELADYHGPVITNFDLAQPWLEFVGALDLERTPMHLIVHADIHYELDRLLHAEVGQRDAIFTAFEQHFYGPPLRGELVPEAWPPGTVVVLIDDEDLPDTLDLARWQAAMTVFAEGEGLVFARLHEAAP
jgi:hypothetical protein